jgi:hypothetical protein
LQTLLREMTVVSLLLHVAVDLHLAKRIWTQGWVKAAYIEVTCCRSATARREGRDSSEFFSSSKLKPKTCFSLLHFDTGKHKPVLYLRTFLVYLIEMLNRGTKAADTRLKFKFWDILEKSAKTKTITSKIVLSSIRGEKCTCYLETKPDGRTALRWKLFGYQEY